MKRTKEELEKAIEILKKPITVTSERYFYFEEENYKALESAYKTAQSIIEYIEFLLMKED